MVPAALMLSLLGLAPAHGAALGDPIDEALALHITPQGLATMGEVVERLVPESLAVSGLSGSTECDEDDAVPLSYDLDALDILINVDEVAFDTADGLLTLSIIGGLSSTQSTLDVAGDCTVLTDFDETCTLELPLTSFEAVVALSITETEGAFDVITEEVSFSLSPIGNPLEDCTLADVFGTVLGLNEEALSALLVSLVEPSLEDLGATMEESLEDLFAELDLETDLEVGDSVVALSMYPSLIQLDERGLVLGLGAEISGDTTGSCVDSSAGSTLTGAGWPDFVETAGETSLNPDMGLYIGKDFGDHLLYALWAAGLFCIDPNEALGGSLTAGAFATPLGELFASTFAEDAPVTMVIDPAAPPTMGFSHDGAPLRIELHELGLELEAPLNEREVRVLRTDIEGDIGIAIELEDYEAVDTGLGSDTAAWVSGRRIATGIDYDADRLVFLETYSDLVPPGYGVGLSSLVGGLIGQVIPADALPSVNLPDLFGLEVAALVWESTADESFHGGFILLDASGVQPLELGGCQVDGLGCDGGDVDLSLDDALDCDSAGFGCDDSGCATAPTASAAVRAWRGRLGMILGLGLLMGLRRR